MKKMALLLLLAALALTGCRVRTVSDTALADTVVREETPEEQPEQQEPEVTLEEESPQEDPPEETETVSTEQVTDDSAQDTRPNTVGGVSDAGAEMLRAETALDVTVTYDDNGGDTGRVSAVVHTGEPYGSQPTPSRRGYAFSGWWTLPSGGEEVTEDTVVTETDDHTLYAHWTDKPTCTVTFDGNGGRVKAKQATIELSDGDRYGQLPTPLREGYTFNGWFTQEGEEITAESVFTGDQDCTLYAQWTYDPYAFWSFTLKNRTEQVYLCQQVSIYFEQETDGLTTQVCPLITATGSYNIAENREDAEVTDDWVRAKKPQVVVKEVSSPEDGGLAASLSARFPDQEIVLVSDRGASVSGGSGLYAALALAKHLYPDWYEDVDLATVAQELEVSGTVIRFS